MAYKGWGNTPRPRQKAAAMPMAQVMFQGGSLALNPESWPKKVK